MRFSKSAAIFFTVVLLTTAAALQAEAQGPDLPIGKVPSGGNGGGNSPPQPLPSPPPNLPGIPAPANGGRVSTVIAPAETVTVPASISSGNSNDGGSGDDASNATNGMATNASAGNKSSSKSLNNWAIAGIAVGGFVALCAGLAAYSRWTRKGRNRRFEELQFGAEDNYSGAQNPFAQRPLADPFKKDLGAHHHTGNYQ